MKFKTFCIDFDGTIAYDAYPKIGGLIPGAKETMKQIKKLGGTIIIWTCRNNEAAIEARKFLEDNDIPFDYFNESIPEHINEYNGDTRKVFADCYIDDRGLLFQKQPVNWKIVQHIIFKDDEQCL
jgi:hydroxymethylpyrimidine pyrophosphatase-like HAD family hydrolase